MFGNATITLSKNNLFNSNSATQTSTRSELERKMARKQLMMALTMDSNTLNVQLVGKLNAASAPLFKEFVKSVIASNTTVRFDLAQLETLDGAGVAALVWANLQMGGSVSVANPSQSLFKKLIALNFQHLVQIENFSLAA